MLRFALRNAAHEEAGVLALLECFDDGQGYYFELAPHVDPWDLPFILHEFAQRGEHTVDAQWSLRWVQSRLVPAERQNLGEVLRTNGLSSYNELDLLVLTDGQCSQDDCYLVPLGPRQEPAWYLERLAKRIADVYALEDFRLLVPFRDGKVVLCDAKEFLGANRSFARVLGDETVFARVTAQPGGHGAQWGEALQVPASALLMAGRHLGLGLADVAALARQATIDTAEVARILGCSRQNVSDLVRRGKLVPLRTTARGPLFLRGDVYARLWQ